MTPWTALPLRVRTYICTAALCATPICLLAIRNVLSEGQYGYEWLILTAITLVTVPIFVFLPSVSTTVSIGDAYIISISMLYGPSPAVVANTFYVTFQTLLLRRKHNVPSYRVIFNMAAGVLNVWIYSSVYYLLNPSRSHSLEDVILPTFGLAVSFFLSNSFLVAIAIALSTGGNVFLFWYKNYRSLILDFLVSACAGAFIVLFRGLNMVAPLLAAPFVGAVWGINKINTA